MAACKELGVMPEIIASLEEMDWLLQTPVQMEAIPMILGGCDVAVAAQTGSGKTGAFCVPILQLVYESRCTNLDNDTKVPAESTTTDTSGASYIVKISTVDRGRKIAVDSNGTLVQSRMVWNCVRETRAVAHGKWYFVAWMGDEGLGRVGWDSKNASLILGTDTRGLGYGATSMKSYGGKLDQYG